MKYYVTRVTDPHLPPAGAIDGLQARVEELQRKMEEEGRGMKAAHGEGGLQEQFAEFDLAAQQHYRYRHARERHETGKRPE